MTKKHYKAIAEIIRKTTSEENNNKIVKNLFIAKLGEFLSLDNPLFDYDKFKWACDSDESYKSTI